MAKKFYVVWQGRTPGIYNDWNSCKDQVDKFAGARYKSFPTLAEAERAFQGASKVAGTRLNTLKSAGPNTPNKPAGRTAVNGTIKTYSATEVNKLAVEVKIFTDGGCEPNPGQAGSGMAVYRNEQLSELYYGLYNPMGTNNTAELNALYQALLLAKTESELDKSVAIFCDSKYSIQCVTQWAIGWEKRGWKKAGGEIKNLDIIKRAFELHQPLKNKVQVLHVNGHVGVEGNELADRMSILAIASKTTGFKMYSDKMDVAQILAMQAG